jgi:ribosomal protein S18 acetylase RimI-like enzyme
MQVRRYTGSDRPAVVALAPRLTEGVAGWRDRAAVRESVLGWVTSSLDTVDGDSHAVFVADDDGVVLGFVTCGERAHFTGQVDGYVGELVVAGGCVRRGVGSALMRAAEQWAADRGLSHLTLETGAANTSARGFYGALGYRDEDVRLTKRVG